MKKYGFLLIIVFVMSVGVLAQSTNPVVADDVIIVSIMSQQSHGNYIFIKCSQRPSNRNGQNYYWDFVFDISDMNQDVLVKSIYSNILLAYSTKCNVTIVGSGQVTTEFDGIDILDRIELK